MTSAKALGELFKANTRRLGIIVGRNTFQRSSDEVNDNPTRSGDCDGGRLRSARMTAYTETFKVCRHNNGISFCIFQC